MWRSSSRPLVVGVQDDRPDGGLAQVDCVQRHARGASATPTTRRLAQARRHDALGPATRRAAPVRGGAGAAGRRPGPGRRRAAPRPRRTGSRRRASAACTPRSDASPSSAFAAAAPARLSITTKAKTSKAPPLFDLRTARDDHDAVLEGTTRPARGRGVMSSLLLSRGGSSQKLSGGRGPAPRASRWASPVCRRRTCPSSGR